jgi:hypothetical protein
MRIVFPDLLTWQAGLEHGLLAIAACRNRALDFTCDIADRGPALEAIAFAVHQLKLQGRVHYHRRIERHLRQSTIVLLPRVHSSNQDVIHQALELGKIVVTSDPGVVIENPRLFVFPRRSSEALVNILSRIWLTNARLL